MRTTTVRLLGPLAAVVLAVAACGAPSTPPAPGVSPAAASDPVAAGSGPFGGSSSAGPAASEASSFTPVAASVLDAPIPVPATDGRVHLAYELVLTNTLSQPATVAAVEVRGDPDRPLLRLEGDGLAAWIKPFGGDAGTRVLGPGQGALIWLDVTLAPTDPVPARLVHRLDVQFGSPIPPLVPAALTEVVAPTPVSTTPPVRIGAPLAGPGWLDGNSCCGLTAHRGAVSPIDGRLWAPERFAVDCVRIDASGRMLTGDPTQIASYPYFGTDIHAVADGPVVALVSDQPEQPPGANPTDLTLAQYGGNYVVQDIGGGAFAFYAHQQPGNPLGIVVGQPLRRGQVLGRLGSSGNSDSPHLHFHVMDRPDPLAANGLPFEIESFTLDGRVASEESLAQGSSGPVPFAIDRAGAGPRSDASPLTLDVMSYPPAP